MPRGPIEIRARRRYGFVLVATALATLTAGCRTNEAPAALAVPLPAARARALNEDLRFERTAERVERGRYLADAAIGCGLCHSERDWTAPGAPLVAGREYAGAVIYDDDSGFLAAPNLTPDAATGAGTWSDDAFARAIREGVGHDGRGLGGVMWWRSFRALADEDLAAIVVYLRSLPPVANAVPARRLSPERELPVEVRQSRCQPIRASWAVRMAS